MGKLNLHMFLKYSVEFSLKFNKDLLRCVSSLQEKLTSEKFLKG